MNDPIQRAIQNAQADELRRWREMVARLEADLVARTNRGEWTGLALALSIVLNVVLVAMLFR